MASHLRRTCDPTTLPALVRSEHPALTVGMTLKIKRVYEPAAPADGFRVLVDRLWPRGLSKERAAIDLWDKAVAPSSELRTAIHHNGMAWPDFEVAYRAEVAVNPAIAALRETLSQHPTATLLYSTHDDQHNHAILLREALLHPER